MPSNPLILAFDTSAAHCVAVLLSGNEVVATRHEDMARGQGERLFPLLEELLTEANKTWRDLSAIGVGIGPGNFTGIRISVSAARGLALALDIPAVGVSTFDMIGHYCAAPHAAMVPAPRDQAYVKTPDMAPKLMAQSEAHALGLKVHFPPEPSDMAVAIAKIAARDYQTTTTPPAPLYIRAADAAPSRDAPPVLLPDDA